MKKLLATIALLCLSSTVLAHDIYSNLRDRDGNLCCGGQDCMPVQIIICRKLMKLFLRIWQHHHLMIVSTIVSIIHEQVRMILGMEMYGKANLRLDASLLQ